MSSAELRSAVKDLRQDPPTAEPDERAERGLTRWVSDGRGDLSSVEYELWQDRVYRIRWRLSEDFERPVIDVYSDRAKVCFGRPDYDQKFEAEPGSGHATFHRIGWTHGERRIEVRQLHPLRGGPVYLSVSDNAILREVSSSSVAMFPEPERSAPWWQRSMRLPEPASEEERERLGSSFLLLLSQLDH